MKFLLISFTLSLSLSAQTLTNDEALIYTESDALIHVEGSVLNKGIGTFEHEGLFNFTENFTNNSDNEAFVKNLPGHVYMTGGTQEINGSHPTSFYHLHLEGGASLKQLQQHISISKQFDLNAAEFNVHNSIAHLTNPTPEALVWTTGFISGDSIGGYFARSTNQSNSYWFPVGSTNLSNNYRAVELLPNSADSTVFGVRLAGRDASSDETGTSFTGATGAYNRALKPSSLQYINEKFYHHIARFSGTATGNYKIFFFNGEQPNNKEAYKHLAQWNKATNQWEKVESTFYTTSGLTNIGAPTHYALGDFNPSKDDPIALATSTLFIPQGFSPNGDGQNEAFIIEGLEGPTELNIYNRYGEVVFQASDYNNDFKGFANKGVKFGEQLPDGTYFYLLKFEDDSTIQSFLTIKR